MNTAASNDLTVHEYSIVHKISKLLIDGNNFKMDMKQVLDVLSFEMGMSKGMVSVLLKKDEDLHANVSFGFDEDCDEMYFLSSDRLIADLVSNDKSLAIVSLNEAPVVLNEEAIHTVDRNSILYICVPISYAGKVVGVLAVDHCTKDGTDLGHEVCFIEEVALLVASRVRTRREEIKNEQIQNQETGSLSRNFVGNSDVMRQLSNAISKVADSSTSVLITGETGTGKEVVAKEIHEMSPRKNAPLVKVNCGAIPENLIESELFGHEKGAFTGAVSQRKGRFEMARGGTIFLDEIGELPMSAQVKLLRVLQEREFERVGGAETIKINVRVIAATNRSLELEVEENNFRADLYYRLNVFPIHVPPLRERGADIMLLADHFVQRYAEELGKSVLRIDTPAIDMLMAYHWPGNVRELENTIERAVLLSDDQVIHGHHLPPSLQLKRAERISQEKGKFETLVQNYERQLIVEALKESWGNQTEAARVLGTTKRVVQYKIQKLGIDYRRYSRNQRSRTGT